MAQWYGIRVGISSRMWQRTVGHGTHTRPLDLSAFPPPRTVVIFAVSGTESMATIVCVDDDPAVAVVVEHTLSKLGHRPLVHSSIEDALQAVARTSVDLIIADYGRPTPGGIELLRKLEQRGLGVPVIIMTGQSSVENAVASIEKGAIDYVAMPIRPETLRITVNRALEIVRLRQENETLRAELGRLESTADGSVFNLDELERSAIGRALTATGGNRTRAAKLLGISERTLRNKLNTPKLATPRS